MNNIYVNQTAEEIEIEIEIASHPAAMNDGRRYELRSLDFRLVIELKPFANKPAIDCGSTRQIKKGNQTIALEKCSKEAARFLAE